MYGAGDECVEGNTIFFGRSEVDDEGVEGEGEVAAFGETIVWGIVLFFFGCETLLLVNSLSLIALEAGKKK